MLTTRSNPSGKNRRFKIELFNHVSLIMINTKSRAERSKTF